MGQIIDFRERAARPPGGRRPSGTSSASFHFDLACPFTYLALERVERQLPEVRWRPTCAEALHRGDAWGDDVEGAATRAAAERRARELHLPLSWPSEHPGGARSAMRAALYAAEQGRGGAFALAAARLAFCGGFDLGDPEVLAEAAAASGLSLDGCFEAVGDIARDGPLEEAGRWLLAAGADRLPALRVGRVLHCGEQRVAEAAAALRGPGRFSVA